MILLSAVDWAADAGTTTLGYWDLASPKRGLASKKLVLSVSTCSRQKIVHFYFSFALFPTILGSDTIVTIPGIPYGQQLQSYPTTSTTSSLLLFHDRSSLLMTCLHHLGIFALVLFTSPLLTLRRDSLFYT